MGGVGVGGKAVDFRTLGQPFEASHHNEAWAHFSGMARIARRAHLRSVLGASINYFKMCVYLRSGPDQI